LKNILITVLLLGTFVGAFLFFGKSGDTAVVYKENHTLKPLMIEPNKMLDPQCKMYIETQKHSAQVVMQNHKSYFFDDVGCMVLWLKELGTKMMHYEYVFSEDTSEWIEAQKACFKIGIHTPMHYGFGAYEHHDKECISYDEFKLKMYRGETMENPLIRKKYLGK